MRSLIKAAFICFCALLGAGLTVAMLLSYAAIGTCDYECPSDATFTVVKVLLVLGAATFIGSIGTALWWALRRAKRAVVG